MVLTMAKKRRDLDAGGRELLLLEARGTSGRVTTSQRARRGDFEWLAGRGLLTAPQEQAGRLARGLWESIHRGPKISATWVADRVQESRHGPQESILAAMQRAQYLVEEIGRVAERRLRGFLLDAMTMGELAHECRVTTRDMSAILRSDLDSAARYFGYDPSA